MTWTRSDEVKTPATPVRADAPSKHATPAILLLLALLALPATARAGEPGEAFRFDNEARGYVLGGLTGGGSFGSAGGGGYLGGEVSAAWLKELLWGGFFVDGVYDFGLGAGTLSAGPEVGYGPLGLDGGVAMRLGLEDRPEVGYQGRLLITAGVLGLYGRYGYWPGAPRARHVGQVGLLLKIPLWSAGPLPEIAR